MKLSLKTLEVPPPSLLRKKSYGWSDVFIHLQDDDLEVWPSVNVKVHVPYNQNQSYREVRKLALERAREIIQAASAYLDQATLEDLDEDGPGAAG